jgi:hypothetical protein
VSLGGACAGTSVRAVGRSRQTQAPAGGKASGMLGQHFVSLIVCGNCCFVGQLYPGC